MDDTSNTTPMMRSMILISFLRMGISLNNIA